MRKLNKGACPPLLEQNWASWTAEYEADKSNNTKKYRYRDREIKRALLNEAGSKCVYCESKIGHNCPGDVEHKVPSSVNSGLHFNWENLTIACNECNRRKLDYYSEDASFLDPYDQDIEARVVHLGPLVSWRPGDEAAEVSIRILELHDYTRSELIKRKIEAIDELNNLVARLARADGLMKELLRLSIQRLRDPSGEYSGMLTSISQQYGIG